ncbi:GH92 family glycosyl hydrolase [Echinicola sp. 20G]|uniref:GH92 family glycosyl hydrolase n=1 Tax=Echinicola sp. 20G TaxID=2781961 RepID=UPI00191030FB|nr:GH92 family glycosyl hydrolase [Echinicola sp. 20G]
MLNVYESIMCYFKKVYFLLFLLITNTLLTFGQQSKRPAYLVNPLVGATTSVELAGSYHGLGKTFPGVATPFGMVQVSPNTITGGDNGSGYSDEHRSIEGFAMTQMSGVGWYGDLGNFLVMPTAGKLKTVAGSHDRPEEGYRSRFDKESEKAMAGYYKVYLTDYDIKAELTASKHCGMMRFTFNKSEKPRIQIDLARRVGGTSTEQYIEIVNDHTIRGWMKCDPEGGGWGNGAGKASYTVYFYTQFSEPMLENGVWSAEIPPNTSRKLEAVTSKEYLDRVKNAKIVKGISKIQDRHIGFFTEFDKSAKVIKVKTGISFTNYENAQNNLSVEMPHWNFKKVRENAIDAWNEALGKVKVSGGSLEEQRVFYTALYHTLIDPRDFTDVNGDYFGGDGKIHKAEGFTKRTVFSGWDVFRSQFPLQTILNPDVVNDMINSLISLADEAGMDYLERWEFLNAYSGCMIGNPAVSVIADAYMKGIRSYDANRALDLAVNTSNKFGNGPEGYVSGNYGISETMEYSYSDWCTGVLADSLGHHDIASRFIEKGKNYVNVFDDEKGWFRPKGSNGKFLSWPDAGRLEQWYGCIESNPYQQGWFVPHDISGMFKLMGEKEDVVKDLTCFFENAPNDLKWNDYYNHANEPVHHVPFLFNFLDQPWLTQKWTRYICKIAYRDEVDGLVGNEDVGQMSAWYVLASSGLYQVCPGNSRYEITSPVFDEIVFSLDPVYATGKTFTVIAHNNSDQNIYIQKAVLNGIALSSPHLDYSDISKGGKLELFMGSAPKTDQW